MPVTVNLETTPVEVQRIFCIGRNYAAHAAELGNAAPAEPVIFMKPPTAIVPTGREIVLPRDRGPVHHEAELVLLVGRDGANGADGIAGVTLGLDLTLRAVQSDLKSKSLPWELAKAFDGSAPLGGFVAPPADPGAVAFDCRVNGELRQHGETRDMLFPVPRILAFLSRHFALRRGDLVFTGTPEGIGPLVPGDLVELSSDRIGEFRWRCA